MSWLLFGIYFIVGAVLLTAAGADPQNPRIGAYPLVAGVAAVLASVSFDKRFLGVFLLGLALMLGFFYGCASQAAAGMVCAVSPNSYACQMERDRKQWDTERRLRNLELRQLDAELREQRGEKDASRQRWRERLRTEPWDYDRKPGFYPD